MVYIPPDQIWMVAVGFVIAFILALGIGANDVANAFGTSVGAKVLTLRQACILATIFETAGAVLLGAKVSDTVRKGVIDVDPYQNETEVFMVGNVAALTGACLWLIIATVLKMPVSGTHSIIGAIVGFALVAHGANGINWTKLGLIVASWFVSPVLSGTVSVGIFFICKHFILSKKDPLEPGLKFLPIFYSVTILINMFSIFFEGPDMLGFDRIPLWGTFLIAFGTGIGTALGVRFVMVPWQRKRILETTRVITDTSTKRLYPYAMSVVSPKADPAVENGLESVSGEFKISDSSSNGSLGFFPLSTDELAEMRDATRLTITDRPEQVQLFSYLQILTAIFGGFAHGGNDVSNAIGPLISIWLVATTQTVSGKSMTPIWILFIGGIGISLGLWIWGRRVIKTMGEDLAKVTPSAGFAIEIGAALTVLVASNVGIPVSSTHCKVGSIVFVGRFRSKDNVDWSLFRNIILAWVLTLPVSGGFSAAVMAGLRYAVPGQSAGTTVSPLVNTTSALVNTTAGFF